MTAFHVSVCKLVPECHIVQDVAAARDDGSGTCDNWNCK